MSIEPAWFSTIFAVIILSGEILIAFAFVIILLAWFQPHAPFREVVTDKHFHDLGNLLLAFVMFWTYVAFSQFLIIYSGNQPHEIGWYLHRIAGDWKWLVAFLGLFHFFMPFVCCFFAPSKTTSQCLAAIAFLIFFVNIAGKFLGYRANILSDRNSNSLDRFYRVVWHWWHLARLFCRQFEAASSFGVPCETD